MMNQRNAGSKKFEQIKHVVVLMLENRSFDQMLGDYQNYDREEFKGLDGIDAENPIECQDLDGIEYRQSPAASRTIEPDPPQELDSVLRQLGMPMPVMPSPPEGLKGDRLRRFEQALGAVTYGLAQRRLAPLHCLQTTRMPAFRKSLWGRIPAYATTDSKMA